MNEQNTNTELFDAYIQIKMDAAERLAFEQKLQTDAAFAEEFKTHCLLVELIKTNARLELKAFLKEQSNVVSFKPQNWLRSKVLAIAAVCILLLGTFIVVQYVSQPKMEQSLAIQTSTELPAPESNRGEVLDSTSTTQRFIEMEAVEKSKAEDVPPRIEELQDKEIALAESAPPAMDDADYLESKTKEAVDIPIAREIKTKDTILYALTLTMLDVYGRNDSYGYNTESNSKMRSKALPAAANNSNQAKALEKDMNTDTVAKKQAKLSSKVAPTKTKYSVEFWTSPVNFKGYRLVNNTVQLYGLVAQNYQLYLVNGKLYLKHQNKVYALDPCADACPYHLEADPDIIQFILKQN